MATTQMVSRAKDKQLRILGVTANFSAVRIPAGHMISFIAVYNRTTNAITGGLNIGTTDDGQEIVATFAVGASALDFLQDTEILKRIFSLTAVQQLFIHAETSWNSANIDIFIGLEKLRP